MEGTRSTLPALLSSPVLLYIGAGRALGRGCSSAHGTCVDQPASITSTASQAPPQYDAEDGTHGTVASNELCHTAVPATVSLSQARTVTLR